MGTTGWIKLHRSLLESPIWRCLNSSQKVVAITCLMLANHEQNKYYKNGRMYFCDRGQFFTSLPRLADACGEDVSIQQTRTALKHLVELEFLTDTSTTKGRLITIVNWELYQGDGGKSTDRPTDRLTGNQQTDQQAINRHNKNDKKYKNEKNLSMTDDTDDDDDAYMGLNEFYSETADRQRREAWKKRRASHE